MILWKKWATAEWLALNETRLEQIAGGDLAIITRPGHTQSLVQATCRSRRKSAQLLRAFGGGTQTVPRNWWQLAHASQMLPLIRVGRRLEIVSARGSRPSGKLQLVIPAAGAFGTGEHGTTAMSLRLLEETTRKLPAGWRLLDAGTGTGILALAARHLGAAEVLGLDNDPRAIVHARQNARRNQIGRARFVTVDLLRFKSRARYEVVTANLFSELLIAALPVFRRVLRPNGCLIVSGILREQAEAVVRALAKAQFHLAQQRRRGKWIALRVVAGIGDPGERNTATSAGRDHRSRLQHRERAARKS